MLARQKWQPGLMPQNVSHRRTEPLRHRNDFHVLLGKREERQIFLQHKERETMPLGEGQESAQQGKDVLRHAAPAALDDRSGDPDVHVASSSRPDSSFDRRRTLRTPG